MLLRSAFLFALYFWRSAFAFAFRTKVNIYREPAMFPPLSSHGGVWYGLRSSWQLADAYTVRVHCPSTASKMPKEIRCLRSSKIWWIQPQVGCECLQLAQISSQLKNWQKHYPHNSKHWIRAFGSELQGPGHAAASIVTSIYLMLRMLGSTKVIDSAHIVAAFSVVGPLLASNHSIYNHIMSLRKQMIPDVLMYLYIISCLHLIYIYTL